MDENIQHDHSYYGTGCSDPWGDVGGSRVACASRMLSTKDDESQKNGTNYNFQAATSGKGGAISTDNANSPDTFCPLGWQLPYGGTGGDYYDQSKSWIYLLSAYSYSYGTNVEPYVQHLNSYPFSLVFGGSYIWNNVGAFSYFGIHGMYHTPSSKEAGRSYRFYIWGKVINGNFDAKFYGNNIRCPLILAMLKSNHNPKLAENNKVF